jgi:hypothetical protein
VISRHQFTATGLATGLPVRGRSAEPERKILRAVLQAESLVFDPHQSQANVNSLGRFKQPFVWRQNITGVMKANTLVYWNIEKT